MIVIEHSKHFFTTVLLKTPACWI